ncbi:MAG TPA: hypothetical protein VHO66_06125 [Ruminiclostridium sp.]|nr:hypothetical protein [Ruminiclostridium sp.]
MKINFNKSWVIAKINFRHLKLAYIITILTVLSGISNLIQYLFIPSNNKYVDSANYLYMLVILAPIFVPALNFRKIMHLNGKKLDFYWGSLINYCIIAAVVSFLNIVLYLQCKAIFGPNLTVWNLVSLFGWMRHGVAAAFFQQFAFLILAAIAIHTLVSIQTFWFGWAADAILAAVISVFIPIPVLRQSLLWFFNLIIFNDNAFLQIIVCLLLAAVIYSLYLPALQRKKI